jgi:hypothetical protein
MADRDRRRDQGLRYRIQDTETKRPAANAPWLREAGYEVRNQVPLNTSRWGKFLIQALQYERIAPSSRLESAREHYRCGIGGTSSRYSHFAPGLEHELFHDA